jgi:alkaline phosphatase
MKRKLEVTVRLAVVVSLVLAVLVMSVGAAGAAPTKPLAKNIIYMIADGSGYNHYLATDYYQFGETGLQPFEQFPFQFAMSTYPAPWPNAGCDGYDPAKAWSIFNYVQTYKIKCTTDSAAAATALATGAKTLSGYLGVDPDKKPLVNLTQTAESKGLSTGVITTVPLSHATPAGFTAHNSNRNDYVNIGKEMILQTGVDVIMGAGNPFPNADGCPATASFQYVGGQSTWDALVAGTAGGDADGDGVADPWTLIQERSQFQALAWGDTPKRLIGVPYAAETLQQDRCGNVNADPFVVPLRENVPTLPEMTRAALNVLDNNPKGFFLMVEGGAVDYAAHAHQPGRMIEERIDFNNAVGAVLDWVQQNSNWGETLLVVAADHETGYLWGTGTDPSGPTWAPVVNNGAGDLPGMTWWDAEHTNSLVPIWAKGDAARFLTGYADQVDPVRGRYLDNTELAKTVFRALEPVKQK